jgi:hypothetical protein
MRILITGSRDWESKALILEALRAKANRNGSEVVVVHGACPTGADMLAEELAQEYRHRTERHPADWTRHDEGCPPAHEDQRICKRAGFRRNAEMVALGADVCLAFIRNESSGATHTANLAEQAGIPTYRYTTRS